MQRLALWMVMILMTSAGMLTARAAEPATRPAGDRTTIFDETFPERQGWAERFKMVPVASGKDTSMAYDKERGGYSVQGYISLVRPVQVSPRAVLSLDLEFLALAADAKEPVETDLNFVLMNRSVAGTKVIRTPKDGKPSAVIQFWIQRGDAAKPMTIREFPLAEAPVAVKWELEYRHGLISLHQGERLVGRADTKTLGIPVAGVVWTQRGGGLVCKRMTLYGQPPRPFTDEERATLMRAAALNREATTLRQQQKLNEALASMRQSSELYVKVHGEQHHDSGNSLTNLATILGEKGDRAAATELFNRALAIHEATLGPDHPHTAMTRFQVGRMQFEVGDFQGARAIWTQCRDDWKAAYGPDWPLVKTLDEKLK